jgi:sec-independent protein translocase protein TatB
VPGLQEWLVIAVIALLVFGPDRLPEVARTAGKWLGRLRSETTRNVNELKRMSEVQELQAELRGLRRDLDGAGKDLRRQVRDASRSAEGRGDGRSSPTSRGGDGAAGGPEDDAPVPPMDPEAT